jgi:hypothetical protein
MSHLGLLSRTLCLLLWLLCPAVRAQHAPSPYEDVLAKSLAAHAAGDYQTARSFMEQAHTLEPSARTLRGLGIIAYAQQRYTEAVFPLESSLTAEVRPLTPALRASVESLLAQTFQRIGRLRLSIDPEASSVLLDGSLPIMHGPHELLVLPGSHRLQLAAPARAPYELNLTTTAGALETLHIVLPERSTPTSGLPNVSAERAASPHEAPVARTARDEHLARWSPRLRNGVVLAGGAVALGGLGLWLTAWGKFKGLDATCRDTQAGSCTRDDATERFEDAHIQPLSRGGVALVALGVASLGVSLTLSLLKRRDRRPLSVAVLAQGMSLRQSF